ncbi:unnamed protein product [Rhodiola kirilowii]
MAEHLASIFGTEKDRVNCPFYFKIGACRHGDRCSRLHTKPSISPTILLSNMYQRPDSVTPGVDPMGQPLDPKKIQDHFEDFYEDLFEELSKYGEVESLNICDNLADHMVGNVYVQFSIEDQAENAVKNLTGRFYAGRPIIVDFSPVTDFREATCRQYEENVCNRGGYCNFMHLKKIGRELRRKLFGGSRRRHSRSRSRSRSPVRNNGYDDRPRGSRGYDDRPRGGRGYDDRPSGGRGYDDRPYGGRGFGRRGGDRDRPYEGRGRRPRSRSPGYRGRSRSPGARRNRSPVREGSAERRAKIEMWNKQREQTEVGVRNEDHGTKNEGGVIEDPQNGRTNHDSPRLQQDRNGGYDY